MTFRPVEGTPIAEETGGVMGGQMELYLEYHPLGPYRHTEGTIIWTDGSKRGRT